MRVTFLGLGVMGFPMAGHLSRAGHEVTVFNRTAAKSQAWVEEFGGKSAPTTIDHMPPRLMFRMSQRPNGLIFPSCFACNNGTSKLDVVAAYMARTFPGISNGVEEHEWEKL